MLRHVGSTLSASVTAPADLVLSVAVADGPPRENEVLDASVDGSAIALDEVADSHGGRLHVARQVPVGTLEVRYEASITGTAAPEPMSSLERIVYQRPSRYCEVDRLQAVANAEFAGLTGADLLHGVSSWVGSQLAYVSGSSRPIDGAVHTLLARQGVCRDYAHLVVALLRALGMPARLTSVYAPGLNPMDFHAVAEAYLDGGWQVVDATCLAPRTAMVRIATGRDAADTAFLTVLSGGLQLQSMQVMATVDPQLPNDDMTQLVSLS